MREGKRGTRKGLLTIREGTAFVGDCLSGISRKAIYEKMAECLDGKGGGNG